MNLGKRIYYYRTKNNLTQNKLAEGICSITYLSKVENGKMHPSDEILRLICHRLHITVAKIRQNPDKLLEDRLLQWHNQIRLKNTAMYTTYRNLKNVEEIQSNPTLRTLFQIIEFHYHLQAKDLDLLKTKIDDFSMLESVLEKEHLQYFYKLLGIYHYLIGELTHSLSMYLKSEKHLNTNETDDPDLYYQLSLVTSRLNLPASSLLHAQRALKGFQQDQNFQRCLESTLLIAINLNDINAPLEAIRILTNLIENNKQEIIPNEYRSKIFHNLGFSLFLAEQYNKAISHFEISLRLKEKISKQLSSLYMLAKCILKAEGDFLLFFEKIQEGLHKSRSIQNKVYESRFFLLKYNHPRVLKSQNYFLYIEKILPLFLKNGEIRTAIDLCSELANYYKDKFHYKKATHYFEKLNYLEKQIQHQI